MAAASSSPSGGSVPAHCIDALKSVVVPPPIEQLRMNKPADETWQDRLRRAHRGELDVTTLPVYRFEGKQYALSVPNLERAYVRRQLHMQGYKSSLCWSVRRVKFGQTIVAPRRGVAFWHAVGGNVPTEVRLPLSFETGLRTAVCKSGLTVHLLAYQHITNAPRGVVLHDAAKVLPWDIFSTLVAHVPVQCVSDLVRARALYYGFDTSGHHMCVHLCTYTYVHDPISGAPCNHITCVRTYPYISHIEARRADGCSMGIASGCIQRLR